MAELIDCLLLILLFELIIVLTEILEAIELLPNVELAVVLEVEHFNLDRVVVPFPTLVREKVLQVIALRELLDWVPLLDVMVGFDKLLIGEMMEDVEIVSGDLLNRLVLL